MALLCSRRASWDPFYASALTTRHPANRPPPRLYATTEHLTALDETRWTARRELKALDRRRETIQELERDKDALLEYYASMVPEALDSLTPEECHQIYKMLGLEVTAGADGRIEVAGTLGARPEVYGSGSTPHADPNL
jgi:hypothetical protein